jgi:putative chitinase
MVEKLKGIVPDKVLAELRQIAAKFGITTPLRLAHFMAQVAHESGEFKAVAENMNYSAARLKQVFPRFFPGTLNESYGGKPEKIGARVYGGRMGNGDETTGEGYKFRGRGYIQLTGKSNYTKFSQFIGEDCLANPDLVSTKYPLASAAFFFNSNNLWSSCDKGATDAAVTEVTKRVNGGLIGLDDRKNKFYKFWNLLKPAEFGSGYSSGGGATGSI